FEIMVETVDNRPVKREEETGRIKADEGKESTDSKPAKRKRGDDEEEETEKGEEEKQFYFHDLPNEIVEKILPSMSNDVMQVLRCDSRLDNIEIRLLSRRKIEKLHIFYYERNFLDISTEAGLRYYTGMDSEIRDTITLDWCADRVKKMIGEWQIDSVTFKFLFGSEAVTADLIRSCAVSTISSLTIDTSDGRDNTAIDCLFTDKFLHRLMLTKTNVDVNTLLYGLTAKGIYDLYEDWFNGRFAFKHLRLRIDDTTFASLSRLFHNSGQRHMQGRAGNLAKATEEKEGKKRCFVLEWGMSTRSGRDIKMFWSDILTPIFVQV
ncbi:hypothetical protein PFISCL1PPCAC_22322, partial [Pristionchus fissidentatus]